MRFRLLVSIATASLLASCASNGTAPPTPEPLAPGVIALQDARQLLLDNNAQDAMLELDSALGLSQAEQQAEVQFLRGVATLRMGTEAGDAFFFEDSRKAFLAAAESGEIPAAWYGAARASWMQSFATTDSQKTEEALDYARKAKQVRSEAGEYEQYFAHSPERTLGEVVFSAYQAAKNGSLPESRAPELFTETLDALEAEVGREPTSPWGWSQIANLYLWEGRREDARTTIASALALIPSDAGLHETQVRLAEEDGSWAEVIRILDPWVAEHEGNALGHWYLGKAYYDHGLAEMLPERKDESASFTSAIQHLERCRAIEPGYSQNCRSYEVVSRDGLGWSHYYAGRFGEAGEAWFSMEEVFEGGLLWEVKDSLLSGLDSLVYAVAGHNRLWEEGRDARSEEGYAERYAEGFQHLVSAADLAFRSFVYSPEDWSRANNAGYFNRDLGVELERQGVAALREDEERAKELFSAAIDRMEKSLEAYIVASKLAPDDARTVNDTGLILAYYLQRDIDRAELYFHDAVRVGLIQLKQEPADSDAVEGIREAIGDAYQNLGVVALTLRGDAATAQPFFEKSLAYAAQPRSGVERFLMPLCEKVTAGEIPASKVIEAYTWGQLEIPVVRARVQAMKELRSLVYTD